MDDEESQVAIALKKGILYWLPIILMDVGEVIELIIVIFLFSEYRKKKSDVKSAYFFIMSLGFIVNMCYAIFTTAGELINWSRNYILMINIITFVQWYAQFSIGPWNAALGFNRCTALAFPLLHQKVGVVTNMMIK